MIVLDTHAWLWWVDAPERLGQAAREAIEASDQFGVCSISCWELATLIRQRRIRLKRDLRAWVCHSLGDPRCRELPLTSEAALRAGQLDRSTFPLDPSDRFIYATALTAGAPLATADAAIAAFDPARTIWD